jgi:hypothetical protein
VQQCILAYQLNRGALCPGDLPVRRRIFVLSLFWTAVFSALSSTAVNVWWFVVWRFMLGLGFGGECGRRRARTSTPQSLTWRYGCSRSRLADRAAGRVPAGEAQRCVVQRARKVRSWGDAIGAGKFLVSINIFFGLGSGVVAAVAYGVVPVIGGPAPAAATASLKCALRRLAADACTRLGAFLHHAPVPQQGARVRALPRASATRGRGGAAAGRLCPFRKARVACRAAQAAMLRDIAQENGRSLEAQRKVCPRRHFALWPKRSPVRAGRAAQLQDLLPSQLSHMEEDGSDVPAKPRSACLRWRLRWRWPRDLAGA